jgi:hypothetical protein
MSKEKEILNIDNEEKGMLNVDYEETADDIKLQSIIDLEKERLNSKNNIFTIKKRRFINVNTSSKAT